METIIRKKLLLLIDGSDQALESVRYISSVAAPDKTDLVLFHVGSGFPEVFWDMNGNPLYRTKKAKVMGWLADYQLNIGEFKEKAFNILSNAGFPDAAVEVKTQSSNTGIIRNILQESYQGYSAVVVGRTGARRIKDRLTGSLAFKLVKKIRHLPLVVVSGKPKSRKVMIALDGSIEAMRGVSSIGSLAAAKDLDISICHCIDPPPVLGRESVRPDALRNESLGRKYIEDSFRPYMDEAVQRLLSAGIELERITCDFLSVKGSAVQKLITTAVIDGYGTIVVGRRDAPGYKLKRLHRCSGEIIASLSDVAVWVVS